MLVDSKRTIASLLATAALLLVAACAASAQTYHLTFDDEFNSISLSNQDQAGDGGSTYSGTWEPWIRSYPARHLSGEAEEYVDPAFYGIPDWGYPLGLNPFSDSNGVLTITAAQSNNANIEGQGYTSGVITSFSSFSQEYGYFEMRAQLPQGAGVWPAFWMLPDSLNSYGDINWNAELDIMECFGAPAPNEQGGGYNQVHWATHDDGTGVSYGNWATVNGDIYTGYHTYGMLWTSSTITFYFDGSEIGSAPTQSDENQPMFLLANLALGGSSSWPGPVANSALPANMNIDYIRAYSSNPNIPAVTPQSGYSPDPNLPISLGGGGSYSGYYRIINRNSGMTLSTNNSTSNGTTIIQDTDEPGWWDQEWSIVQDSDGNYSLINRNSGLALDDGGSSSTYSNETQWAYSSGNLNQEWQIQDDGGGYYSLVCVGSGLAADTVNSTTAGTAVEQNTNNSGYWTQQFELVSD